MRRTSPPDIAKYPIQPLIRWSGLSQQGFAKHYGFHIRQVQRWCADGMPWQSADRVAITCGLHPAIVWDEWIANVTLSPAMIA